MKPTRPSASRRWSRAASRAWIAVNASVLVTAMPASEAGGEPGQPPVPARGLALDQVVEADAEHPGDELEEAHAPAVAAARAGRRRAARRACRSAARGGRICWRSAGGKHSSSSRPGMSLANGSPATIAARTQPSGRVRLKQLDLVVGPVRLRRRRASTARSGSATRPAPPRSPRRGRRRRPAHAGRGRSASAAWGRRRCRSACRPAHGGTRNSSSSRCSQSASLLVLVAVAEEGVIARAAGADARAARAAPLRERSFAGNRASSAIGRPQRVPVKPC